MTKVTHVRDAAAVLFAVAGVAGSSSAQVLLDQSPLTPSLGAETISGNQSELGNPGVRFVMADRITIPAGGANIGVIDWWGYQNGTNTDGFIHSDPNSNLFTPLDPTDPLGRGTNSADDFRIIIHNDDAFGGFGPGSSVATFTGIQPVRKITSFDNRQGGTDFGPIETLYSHDLGGQFLAEGTYWIEIANDSTIYRQNGASNFVFQFNGESDDGDTDVTLSDPTGNGTDGAAIFNDTDFEWIPSFGLIPVHPTLPLNLALRVSDVGSGLTADINGDGVVDILDFVILGDNFNNGDGQAVLGTGDINGDGEVDILDFVLLGDNFGNTLPAPLAAVPEPGSLALLGLGGLALIRRRRA